MKFGYHPTHQDTLNRFAEIKKLIDASKDNINLSFVSVEECPIEWTDECVNQVVVRYRNKRCEILPARIHGPRIKEYLGVKYTRVTHWTVMPFAVVLRTIDQSKNIYGC